MYLGEYSIGIFTKNYFSFNPTLDQNDNEDENEESRRQAAGAPKDKPCQSALKEQQDQESPAAGVLDANNRKRAGQSI